MIEYAQAQLTDRCTWWYCKRPGSVLFTDSNADPTAHLCDTHASLYGRRPAHWAGLAGHKLRPPSEQAVELIPLSGNPGVYMVKANKAERTDDGVLHVELPGVGYT